MKSQDIRQSFLDFFRDRGHQPVPSAPLVPHGDPTLMFTNAGMVQFKDLFLGNEAPDHPRAVSVQKCLRVSGKHNDLENVGPSPRHHTFFEMLGNFSFGDYFKEDAIRFAWELVTQVWGLPPEHLFATVFEKDDEAEKLWQQLSTLPAERILRCGAEDNFWAMGETGPCGPCSEIFVDRQPDQPTVGWEEGNDSGRYIEIWNLVFMQFDRDANGTRPLPNPSIDTGAGLERVSAVLQGVQSNYDTDLFQPILQGAAALASTRYGQDSRADVSLRVIADHVRALVFLLADGIVPGPDGRGYVGRRLLRRALRHGMGIGFEEPFLHRLVPLVDEALAFHYGELKTTSEASKATILEEEEKYLATRALGSRRVQESIDKTREAGQSRLSGEEVFRLYDTFGLELEAIREIAEEERLKLDEEGFEKQLQERRARSRAITGELQKRMASLNEALLQQDGELQETVFVGYEEVESSASILRLAILSGEGAAAAETLPAGNGGVVVLDQTPFYAESGGQVGDEGTLHWEGGHARVVDTRKDTTGIYFHFVEVERGSLTLGQSVRPTIDVDRRQAIERNHTATHLLHAALRQVLGDSVRQAGSLVAPDRLRFDFTYSKPLTEQQLREVESLSNFWIRQAVSTEIQWSAYDDAVQSGAMALFGEKYGDRVRTVEIPGFSRELCGGCHVGNSGAIGLMLISGERGVASGIRRIEAATGEAAFAKVRQDQELLAAVETGLAVPASKAPQEVVSLKNRLKELERELAQMRMRLVSGEGSAQEETEVEGIRLVAREVPAAPKNELRHLADTLRDKLGSGVVVLGSRDEEKVTLIVTVSKDLTGRLSAGKLVGALAAHVGGRGGGRPDFAQAGGKEPEKLPQLLAAVPETMTEQLTTGA